jgi:hypothetical protein
MVTSLPLTPLTITTLLLIMTIILAGYYVYLYKPTYSRVNLTRWVVLLCLILPTASAMPPGTRANAAAAAAAADAVADAVAAVGAAAAAASPGNLPRSSDSYPNMVKDWDFLPGMKRWNGQPFYDFARIWWVALVVLLGTIVQDGNSLLNCAEGTDEGRDPAVDHPDKVRQHQSRNAGYLPAS